MRRSSITGLPDIAEDGRAGYASSLDPPSPSTFHRPPSPRITTPRQRARPRALFTDRNPVRRVLGFGGVMSTISRCFKIPPTLCSVRIIPTIFLWSCALYVVHVFLFPIPGAEIIIKATKPLPKASTNSISHQHLSNFFPPPPIREGDDTLDSVSAIYRPFRPVPPPDPPFPRLRPTRFLPDRCLEQWFADGETICGKGEMGEEETLDVTWLWVNGSDPKWAASMNYWSNKENVYSPIHHFREQNELVHSMRSVLASFPGSLRTFHLITADDPFTLPQDLELLSPQQIQKLEALMPTPASERIMYRPPIAKAVTGTAEVFGRDTNTSTTENQKRTLPAVSRALADHLAANWRVAQAPSWLDYSKLDPASRDHPYYLKDSSSNTVGHRKGKHSYPNLRYAGHSEIFHLPTLDRDGKTEELGEREWREKEWKKEALPSFNSMAIESRIGWLPGLADVSLSLNDDFFLLRPHAVSDFHSPLYGSVIRFDHAWTQQVRPILDKQYFSEAGEVGGLYHANWLLSQRFPRRLRPYFAHVPKVITRGLHHEVSLMFKEALATSSSRRFRELHKGEGDIQMQWLLTSLRVERWREALLWTYVVAKLGTNGDWTDDARSEIMLLFDLSEDDVQDVAKIEVHRGERWTLESGRMAATFEQAGWQPPKATEFLFSSLDGHMPPLLQGQTDPAVNDKCTLDLDRCFGSFWTQSKNVSSADMFQRLAFQNPRCGDCLIMALVTASGPLGLSAFFPPATASSKTPGLRAGQQMPTFLPPPHLPLTPTWQEADFSLASILKTTTMPDEEVGLRAFCMRLLSRYLYLSARSTSHFHMAKSPDHIRRVVKSIDADPSISILGINDDIEEDYETTRMLMNEWFEKKWPEKAAWEH